MFTNSDALRDQGTLYTTAEVDDIKNDLVRKYTDQLRREQEKLKHLNQTRRAMMEETERRAEESEGAIETLRLKIQQLERDHRAAVEQLKQEHRATLTAEKNEKRAVQTKLDRCENSLDTLRTRIKGILGPRGLEGRELDGMDDVDLVNNLLDHLVPPNSQEA